MACHMKEAIRSIQRSKKGKQPTWDDVGKGYKKGYNEGKFSERRRNRLKSNLDEY